jgi:flavorubredoxin
MGKVLIVYATRTGETQNIAELIGEGVRLAGHQADVVNVKNVRSEADLFGYDGYVFGSATYHGDMLQTMKTFLFMAEKASLASKIGGAFGSFGWSGEANDRIYQTMKNIFRMSMVADCLRLKSSLLGGGVQMAQEYGRQLAQKLNA